MIRCLSVLLLGLFASTAAAAPAAGKLKVILDTDPGDDIDDAWALGYILADSRFDLVGVTVGYGNTPARAKLVLKLLDRVGRNDVPVAVGRKDSDQAAMQLAWSEDFTARQPTGGPAADFIVNHAKKHPGEIVLIAVGPLNNVADAIRLEPKLGRFLKRTVLMNGCVFTVASGESCVSKKAEYNTRASREDSQLVYQTLPLTIVPLDSTTHVRLEQSEREWLNKHPTPLVTSLEILYRLWLRAPDRRMILHDQLAVVEAITPGAYFGKKQVVKLIVDDEGYTRVDEKKGKPVTVCLEPKREAFMKHYLERLASLGSPPAAAATAKSP